MEKAEIKLYKKLVMANSKKVIKKAFLDAKKGKIINEEDISIAIAKTIADAEEEAIIFNDELQRGF
mgnify:CR=1 FL=1